MSTLGDLSYNQINNVVVTVEAGDAIVKGVLRKLDFNETRFGPFVHLNLGGVDLPRLHPWRACLIAEVPR